MQTSNLNTTCELKSFEWIQKNATYESSCDAIALSTYSYC